MSSATRARILVVEPDPTTRTLLTRVLNDAGLVPEAASASDAARISRDNGFAAALADVSLRASGPQQYAEDLLGVCPDLALIALARPEQIDTALEWVRLGACDYLVKPPDVRQVRLRVERALERRQLLIARRLHDVQIRSAVRREALSARRVLLGAINSLSSALEAKDDYTRGHSERVSLIGVEIANAVGVGDDGLRQIRLAGRLHDIGKIGLQESVLLKPGRLTEEEYQLVKAHPATGERILAEVLPETAEVKIVRHHHEHYSGGGYPDGLRGSAIPLGARVLAVADTFDALTSDRPYRKRLMPQDALGILRAGAGAQWQPTLVAALEKRLGVIWPIVCRATDREEKRIGELGGKQAQTGPLER